MLGIGHLCPEFHHPCDGEPPRGGLQSDFHSEARDLNREAMTQDDPTYQKSRSGQPLALEPRRATEDGRRYSPSIGRNRDSVVAAFGALMPRQGEMLELASGTGEHGAYMVAQFAQLNWTYSDIDPVSLASQRAWQAQAAPDRLRGPLPVNAQDPDWGEAEARAPWDGMFCANMIHIAPFEAAEGLFAGAGRLLSPGGRLMLYGPFSRHGEIAPSNARFSADLQRRDARWGVRDLDIDLVPLASRAGLKLAHILDMPANNLSVIFEKSGDA